MRSQVFKKPDRIGILDIAAVQHAVDAALTQQLHDRGYAGNGTFDQKLGLELRERLDQEIESFAITQAITNGESVTGATEYKIEKFMEDLAKLREKLTDGAGVRPKPIVFFSTSDFKRIIGARGEDHTKEWPGAIIPALPQLVSRATPALRSSNTTSWPSRRS